MKEIKIFLASSIVEFEKERYELESYINRLNNDYIGRGIIFNLVVCENLSNAVAAGGRKQDEYNDQIRSSQYVYVLVGERVGGYTVEEFDVAFEQFKKTGAPLIYTYFKRQPPERPADASVLAFMQRLGDGIGHFYSEFADLDSIKLNIILELMRDPEVGGVVQFEDGRALLNGQEMMSLENVPIYGGNDELASCRRELEALDARRAELKAAMATGFDDDLAIEFGEVSKERAELADRIHQMEMAVLENCNLIASRTHAAEADVDPREREAMRLTSEGRYREANAVLTDKQWGRDVDAAAEVAQGLRAKARAYVSGRRALVANLKAMGVTEKTEPRILEAYEDAARVAQEWRTELDVLREYAAFLLDQRRYGEGVAVAERLVLWMRLEDAGGARLGQALTQLGSLRYFDRDYKGAELAELEAIAVLEKLGGAGRDEAAEGAGNAGTDEDARRTDGTGIDPGPVRTVADGDATGTAAVGDATGAGRHGGEVELLLAYARGELGTLYWKTKRYQEARVLLDQAVQAMDGMPGAARERLATTLNRLAIVSNGLNLLDDAEAYHRRAAQIREEMARSGNPHRLLDLSATHHNLGCLFSKERRLAEADEQFLRATRIREQLAAENPAAFEANLATTLVQLGMNRGRMGRYDEGEQAIRRGLTIRRRLAAANPKNYLPGVAIALDELGIVLRDAGEGRYEQAREAFEEELRIRETLVEQDRAANEAGYSNCCGAYAELLRRMGRAGEATDYFDRAIQIRRRMAQHDPEANSRRLSQYCLSFAEHLHEQGDDAAAEPVMREAHAIYSRLGREYPDVFGPQLVQACEGLARILEARGGDPQEIAALRDCAREASFEA